jgi:hypothetical protein
MPKTVSLFILLIYNGIFFDIYLIVVKITGKFFSFVSNGTVLGGSMALAEQVTFTIN